MRSSINADGVECRLSLHGAGPVVLSRLKALWLCHYLCGWHRSCFMELSCFPVPWLSLAVLVAALLYTGPYRTELRLPMQPADWFLKFLLRPKYIPQILFFCSPFPTFRFNAVDRDWAGCGYQWGLESGWHSWKWSHFHWKEREVGWGQCEYVLF